VPPVTRRLVRRILSIALTCSVAGAALLALTGCESSQEESARLERAAKRQTRNAPKGLSIAHPSTKVHAVATSVVTTPEGSAAVVTLRNDSPAAVREIPLEIVVKDAAGASVYTNTAPGLSHQLTTAPLVPAHGTLVWVDDQVQSTGAAPKTVTATVGEGTPVHGATPQITVTGAKLVNDPSNGLGGEATVTNHSQTEQGELVVFATAVRQGRIVAAGRAIIPQLAAGASANVQIFFVGNPSGAQLHMNAPATTAP
jgi:hypothetical protein